MKKYYLVSTLKEVELNEFFNHFYNNYVQPTKNLKIRKINNLPVFSVIEFFFFVILQKIVIVNMKYPLNTSIIIDDIIFKKNFSTIYIK